MKTTLFVIVLAAFISSACGEKARSSDTPAKTTATPVPTSSVAKDGDYPGKGKVTKINNELGSVELDHEEIVGVMPRMIMEFYVSDKAMLKGLSVGDQVDFVLRHKGSSETIVKITTAK